MLLKSVVPWVAKRYTWLKSKAMCLSTIFGVSTFPVFRHCPSSDSRKLFENFPCFQSVKNFAKIFQKYCQKSLPKIIPKLSTYVENVKNNQKCLKSTVSVKRIYYKFVEIFENRRSLSKNKAQKTTKWHIFDQNFRD